MISKIESGYGEKGIINTKCSAKDCTDRNQKRKFPITLWSYFVKRFNRLSLTGISNSKATEEHGHSNKALKNLRPSG